MNRSITFFSALLLCGLAMGIIHATQLQPPTTALAQPSSVEVTLVDTDFDSDPLGSLPGPFLAAVTWPPCTTDSVLAVSDEASRSGSHSLKIQNGCTTGDTATGWRLQLPDDVPIKKAHLSLYRRMDSGVAYLGQPTGPQDEYGLLEWLLYDGWGVVGDPFHQGTFYGEFTRGDFTKVEVTWDFESHTAQVCFNVDECTPIDGAYPTSADTYVTGYGRHPGTTFYDDDVKLTVELAPVIDSDNDGIPDDDDDFPLDWSPHACSATPTITGTNGNETIEGTPGDDVIHALGGNDTVNGNGGRDIICGGNGNDTITTLDGDDAIDGDGGHDTIEAGGGDNFVEGGHGNKTISAGDGRDIVVVSGGKNEIAIGGGNNYVSTGNGKDEITTGDGDDTILADGGHNEIQAGAGINAISAGNGNDEILSAACLADIDAGGGHNTIEVGAGTCAISTGNGNDHITRGDGDGAIAAGGGHNTIVAGAGVHPITCGNGNDTITDGDTGNVIDAGGGHNEVSAGGGDDTITALNGNDEIDGGPGTDTCDPGGGNNTVVGCELP